MSKKLLILGAIGLLVACGGSDGKDGTSCTVQQAQDGAQTLVCDDGTSVVLSDNQEAPQSHNSLVEIAAEAAGENCENGGKAVLTGLDANDSGALDADEVAQTTYLCDAPAGQDALQTLIEVSDEPLGDNCAAGGSRIQTGPDTNGDGTLDEAEISQTTFICEDSCPDSMLLSRSANACVKPQYTMYGFVDDFMNEDGLYAGSIAQGMPCRVDLVYDADQTAASDEDGVATYEFSDAPAGIYVTVGDLNFYSQPGAEPMAIRVEDYSDSYEQDSITFMSVSNQMPISTEGSLILTELHSSNPEALDSTSLVDATAALGQFDGMFVVAVGCNGNSGACATEDGPVEGAEVWGVICSTFGAPI